MKVCKLCGSTYGDKVDFCFRDGQPLVLSEEPAAAQDVPSPRQRPGLADMLDVPEPRFARPSDPTALPDATALPDPGAMAGLPQSGAALLSDAPLAGAPLPPTDEDEDLAPPAPLAPLEPTAPVPLVGPEEALAGVAMVSDDELEPPRSISESDLADSDLADSDASDGDASDSDASASDASDSDLAGYRDDEALADLARTLGGDHRSSSQSDDFSEEEDPVPAFGAVDDDSTPGAAASGPALDDLVEDDRSPGDGAHMYIGAEGTSAEPFDSGPVEEKSNKTIFMLFGAAAIVLLFGVAYILATSGGPPEDPMAGLPEEKAAPVVAAPAPPPPQPVVEAPPVEEVADSGAEEAPEDATLEPLDAAATVADPVEIQPTRTEQVTPATATRRVPAEPGGQRVTPVATATPPVAVTPPPPAPDTEDATADIASSTDPWNTGATAASGRLTINTIPAGAIVYVDDRQLGRSPLSAELGFGMHTIRVELGGYSSEQRTIDVQVPEMAVPFELKPLVVTGTVNIFGPTGATVLVDGAQVGKIPTSVKLTEGAHSFEVRTTDGSSFTRSQDVRFDGGTTVSVTLAP